MNSTNHFLWTEKYNRSNKFRLPLFTLNIQIISFSFSFNNSFIKSLLHSSAILKSDSNKPLPQNLDASGSSNSQPITLETSGSSNPRSPILEAVARYEELENERLSGLKLIKYKETPADEEEDLNWESKSPSSTYAESFPWFVDEEGKRIDYDQPIRMFDGVKLISRYLETRYLVNPELISEAALTELLKLFTENENITVAELYDHVSSLYKKDNNFLLRN